MGAGWKIGDRRWELGVGSLKVRKWIQRSEIRRQRSERVLKKLESGKVF
jgi:hypothetical protein